MSKDCMDSFIGLVQSHLCYDRLIQLPPSSTADDDYDVESPYWDIRERIYDLMIQYINSDKASSSMTLTMVNNNFLSDLMSNFNSADERERDKLKVLIHKYIFVYLYIII